MGLPWRTVTVVAATTAYLGGVRAPPPLPPVSEVSVLRTIAIFAAAWLLQLLLWLVGKVLLWPKLLSPLIGLPEPPNPSWFMGQYRRIREEPSGMPAREW